MNSFVMVMKHLLIIGTGWSENIPFFNINQYILKFGVNIAWI